MAALLLCMEDSMQQQSPTRADGTVEQLLAQLDGRIQGVFSFFGVPAQDAEDLLQDTLLALVTKASDVHAPDLWILQTLRNRCASYWRRRRRWLYEEIDHAFRDRDDGNSIDQQEWRCDLREAISRLPRRCQSLLHLRYALGYQTDEMADHLGYREGSVRKAEMRCLSALTREVVQPEGQRT